MDSNANIGLTNAQNSLSAYVSINNNLRHYRNTNVVVRSDFESLQPNIVRIITGRGSGHEPAHSEYVGDGVRVGDELDSAGVHDFLDPYLTVLSVGGVRRELFVQKSLPPSFEGCLANSTINNEIQPFNGFIA